MIDASDCALWEHLESPQHQGRCTNPTHEALAVNPLCGDEVHLQVCLSENGRVGDARFTGRGCQVSQAAASLLCERITGARREDLEALRPADILAWNGVQLSPIRQTCALVAFQALQKALFSAERPNVPAATS